MEVFLRREGRELFKAVLTLCAHGLFCYGFERDGRGVDGLLGGDDGFDDGRDYCWGLLDGLWDRMEEVRRVHSGWGKGVRAMMNGVDGRRGRDGKVRRRLVFRRRRAMHSELPADVEQRTREGARDVPMANEQEEPRREDREEQPQRESVPSPHPSSTLLADSVTVRDLSSSLSRTMDPVVQPTLLPYVPEETPLHDV